MQKTLPLYLGPSVIGSVVLESNEHHLSAVAKTYADVSGICRAYIKSSDGTLLIGVLSPQENAFCAKRHFSKASLLDAGIRPEEITYAYVLCKQTEPAPTFTEWKPVEALPENLLHSKILSTLALSRGAMVDRQDSPTKIAVPLFTGRPFPRSDVLCLMTPCRIDGELFGVIGVSKKGAPEKF